MTVIAIVNRKGGSGKSTLATHVAAWLSRGGEQVMLGDVDRQQSIVPWLRRREKRPLPGAPLVGWALDPRNVLRPPAGVSHVVLDTPGGLHGFALSRLLMHADIVLMPVCDSIFDRESATACLAEIRMHPRLAAGRTQIAAVGMRIDAQAPAPRLAAWAAEHSLPLIGTLRESRAYVRCAESGLSLFDLPAAKVQAELAQWQPVLDWLSQALTPDPAAHAASAAAAMRLTRRVLETAAAREPVPAPVPLALAATVVDKTDDDDLPPPQPELPAQAPPRELSQDLLHGPESQAGPATVFPGDLMRPLGPPPSAASRVRGLLRKLLLPKRLTRSRHR